MIRIYRSDIIPPSLQPEKIKPQMTKLENFYVKQSETAKRQSRAEFDIGPIGRAKKELAADFNHKCAYCEKPLPLSADADLESFRPKRGAKGYNTREFSENHYWWLFYEWKNIFYSCRDCNVSKLSWFPVEGARAAQRLPYAEVVAAEKNLLIDPCNEDPSPHLVFQENGEVAGKTKKGGVTIDILRLNRTELAEARANVFKQYKKITAHLLNAKTGKEIIKDAVISTLTDILSDYPKQPYAGTARHYLETGLTVKENAAYLFCIDTFFRTKIKSVYYSRFRKQLATGEYMKPRSQRKGVVRKPDAVPLTPVAGNRFILERIVIRNFKSIESLELKFPLRPRSKAELQQQSKSSNRSQRAGWLMLLGENGVGKSSFLQAIALTLMGSRYLAKTGVGAGDVLKHGTGEGSVEIYSNNQPDPVSIHFSGKRKTIRSSHTEPQGYLLGYGATRLFATKKLKPERIITGRTIRAMNMFEPGYALYAKEWLVTLFRKDREQFDYAARAIMDLLKDELNDKKAILSVEGGEVLLRYSNRHVDKLDALSDGYKSIIATACDMMSLLLPAGTMETAEGLVIIDEIGTHLHPRWRMKVVESFRNTFPLMQFIATTHDPLCLRGIRRNEVALFRKDAEHKVHAITDLPNPAEMRVDQLLTSEFFGMNSVTDPKLEKMLNEYHLLLSKAEPSPRQAKRITQLEKALRPYQRIGDSWREDLVYKAVDEVIAMSKLRVPDQFMRNPAAANQESLVVDTGNTAHRQAEEEVKERIRSIWGKINTGSR